MIIILTFVTNAGLNFVVGLVVAKFLEPEEFGRYSIAVGVATVVNTLVFDWLRLSATRFYSDRTRREAPEVRASLDATMTGLACTVAGVAAFVAGLRLDVGLAPILVLASAVMSIGNGLFDYYAALSRARFLERTYAYFIIVKNVLAFFVMGGLAYLFQDAALVAFGLTFSVGISLLAVRRQLKDAPGRPAPAERRLALQFLRYGLPLVVANAIYQLLLLLNRAGLASSFGFAEAGHFSLAADLGVRLFAALGSALDILLFQLAVRQDEMHGKAAAERQIARNMTLITALLVPSAAGYWVLLPAFQALLVPAEFRGSFEIYTTVLIPALLAFALIQYVLNPVFQLAKRTAPVIAASLAALGANLVLIFVLPGVYGAYGFAAAQLGGMVIAFIVTLVLAVRAARELPPLRDIGGIILATAVMTAAIWPIRALASPLAVLAAGTVGGAVVYGIIIAAFDIGGLRGSLARRLGRRSGRASETQSK